MAQLVGSDDATQTVDEFIEKHKITLTATNVRQNPHMHDEAYPMFHYEVELTRDGAESMVVYYSVGSAHIERGQAFRYRKLLSGSPLPPQAALERAAKSFKPPVADVLDCLASDSAGIENVRSFEEWAWETGFDVDSRSAERTYEACVEQRDQLLALLGREAFEELLWQTQRQ